MTVGATGGPTGPNNGPTNPNNNKDKESFYMGLAASLGLKFDDSFYTTDANGNKVLDMAKVKEAIEKAQAKENLQSGGAGQADTFTRTSGAYAGTKTEAAQAQTEQERINEEYDKAIVEYYDQLSAADQTTEEGRRAAELWASAMDMQYNLTKTGVTNATVIAGASDAIGEMEKAVAATKAAIEANGNETEEETAFSVQSQQDIEDSQNEVEVYAQYSEENFFANNPFLNSAYDTSVVEEDETIAA